MADRFNPRSCRHQVALLVAAVVAATGAIGWLPAQHALATESCQNVGSGAADSNGSPYQCRYTQLDNTDWPNQTTDPDCHGNCAWFLHGNGPQSYTYSDQGLTISANGVNFRNDMENAVNQWSGEPYNSPWFSNCNCGSGFMTITQGNTGGGACGLGWTVTAWQAYNQTNDNHIVSSTAEYASDFSGPWYDGTPPSNFSGQWCDAAFTALHEVGHAFGEGHSSVNGDVMYWNGGTTTQIDGDATELLLQLYGAYQNSNGGCGGCQWSCTAPAAHLLCSALGIAGYYQKAWQLAHGLTVPNAVLLATPPPSPCLVWWYSDSFLNWLTCATNNYCSLIKCPTT